MVGDFNAYQKQEGVLSQIRCPENYKLIRKKGKGGKRKTKRSKSLWIPRFYTIKTQLVLLDF